MALSDRRHGIHLSGLREVCQGAEGGITSCHSQAQFPTQIVLFDADIRESIPQQSALYCAQKMDSHSLPQTHKSRRILLGAEYPVSTVQLRPQHLRRLRADARCVQAYRGIQSGFAP